MKKFITLTGIALLSLSLYAKDIKTLVVTPTPKMTCQNCEKKIKTNIRFVKGTTKIETNLKTQEITITYDAEKANLESYKAGFKKIGYEIQEVTQTKKSETSQNSEQKK